MKLRKAIAFIQIVCFVFLNVWNIRFAKADDGDIFGTNIEPNVLIVLDTSGSMGDADGTDDGKIDTNASYSSATTYPAGDYNSTRVYRKQGSSYNLYANSVAQVNSSSARNALNSVGFWSGNISGSNVQLFLGNYLNYLFGSCSTCAREDKIDVAKRLINNLINNVEGVRFGVMRFVNNNITWISPWFGTDDGGGGIVAEIGTAPATIASAVNAISEVGWTPLGRQMDDVGRYYKGQTLRNGQTYSTPIQYSCQPNFAIVISDGLWSDQNPQVNPKTEATNRFTQDHSTMFAGTQNVIVHTIGFSLNPSNADEKTALSDLQTMAKNGGGSFFTANNAAQLETALQDAISQILAASFSFANPVIPTTGTTGSTRSYLAAFQSNPSRPFWKGFLKAYTRDSNGLIPVDAQGLPTGTPVWDAGTQLSLKTASSRNIKTVVSGSLQDFTTSNVTATLLGVNSSPFPLNASDATDARNKVVAFIRGSNDYNDEDADNNTSEERPWKLGDIFHSTPVLVSPPFLPSADSTYATFKTTQASRTKVLLAGSNDGMLHAFTESDGEESWAFIPPNLLGDLKNLTALSGTRDYFVDASPIVADVKTGGTWKTIAVFGERRGGKYYYALDVTNTTSPQYLWSFTDSKLGETWSDPAIGKVKMADGTDKWVAFIGGGFDSTHSNYTSGNNMSEAFFAIDLSNGAKLWEYYNATGSTDDRQYMNFSFATAPTAVDLNNDGYIDKVYIGDVGGQVWKFDVAPTGGATLSGSLINNWTGKRLFAAASSQANPPAAGEYYPAQAIYVPPTLAYDANGSLWIFFGTGDRFHPNNTSSNRFYAIKENTSMTNGSALTESSLANLSSGSGTVSQGWYLPLASNEKVLASADVFSSVVFFTTFTPVTAAICGTGGGDAKLYSVNMSTGDAALDLTSGTVLTPGQSALAAARAIGTGIPSKPIVIMSQSGNKASPYIITGTTSQQITNTQIPQVTIKKLVGWREVF
jgi:type IV pilus assembly protein PilY1